MPCRLRPILDSVGSRFQLQSFVVVGRYEVLVTNPSTFKPFEMRVGFFAFLVAALVAFASANAALTSRPKETAFQVAKKSLQKIKHVIVLMMENRSFDHLLGWMKEDTNKNVDGLSSGMTCPRDPNDSSKGMQQS